MEDCSFDLDMEEEKMTDDAVMTAVMDLASSSDEEEVMKWGGSRKGKAKNKEREFPLAQARVVKDYFSGRG